MATSNNKDKYEQYLTKEQIKELEQLTKELTEDAKAMVDDYTKNPSEYSGSVDLKKGLVKGDGVVVHENSPLLRDDIMIEQEDDGEI
tara:strand:+ start:710 stop:970 length:261 start_codon:yes stop_codon:yes gene_type:complete